MNFQEIILELQRFWSRAGCLIVQPYDLEKGAGTFNPATFFGALGMAPTAVAYVEPCRRPADGRYGENPNRLGRYFQFQVLLKPVPEDVTALFLRSLKALGLDTRRHDLRWVEDNWESPTLGAAGLGWEVRLDGMEITQFTYFQQMGSMPLDPISVEITYGLERIALFSQNRKNVFDLDYNDDVSYGALILRSEKEFSRYHFEESDALLLARHFNDHEGEGNRLVGRGLLLPAYDCVMKASHLFNMLDARGAISAAERAQYIARVRALARKVIDLYLAPPAAPGVPGAAAPPPLLAGSGPESAA